MLLTTSALVFVLMLEGAAVVKGEAVEVAEASAEMVEERPAVAVAADAPPCAWARVVRKRRMSVRAAARNVEVEVDMFAGFRRLAFA